MSECPTVTDNAREVLGRLLLIQDMHNRLRCWYPAPSTPEGSFINENTVVRLAAMMEWADAKPAGCLAPSAFGAEKCVRVLFLFRNLIVHTDGGRLVLDGKRRTAAERTSFAWFCDQHPAARVAPDHPLCLDATEVISPLLDGCIAYLTERGKLPPKQLGK